MFVFSNSLDETVMSEPGFLWLRDCQRSGVFLQKLQKSTDVSFMPQLDLQPSPVQVVTNYFEMYCLGNKKHYVFPEDEDQRDLYPL